MMRTKRMRSRLVMYATIFVTMLQRASSSPLQIQTWKSRTHPTKGCVTKTSLFLRDTNILNIRGGYDRGGDYGSSAQNHDYNYGDRDYGTSQNDGQDRYEDDYYGKEDQRDVSYDDRYQDRNNDYYKDKHDDYRKTKTKSRKGSSSSMSFLPDIIRTGNKKVGFALLGSGFIFTVLGITLFFNKALMRLGNLLFIAGIPMTIGPTRTMGYFLKPKKVRATGCLAVGIFLVMIGWPIVGIILEVFGIMNLFGNMFPILKVFLKQVPVLGGIFDNSKPKKSRKPEKKQYYDDEDYYSGRGDSRRDTDQYGEDRRYNY